MNIRELAQEVTKVFEEMSQTFSAYQNSTGLACLPGCGRCCQNPDVEATVLEMIPLAVKIYDEGKLDEWMDRLENNHQDICLLFQDQGNGKGFCGSYAQRPSVCRMFAVAATHDKHQKLTLSICKFIREENQALASEVSNSVLDKNTPSLVSWSTRITNLGSQELNVRKPLNLALKSALEKISLYAQYQNI